MRTATTIASAVAALGALAGPPASAVSAGDPDPPTCAGQPATIVGTQSGDELVGTDGPDVIAALGGKDEVHAGAGDDVVCGDWKRDYLHGGDGDDLILGGASDHFLEGDRLYGEEGRDVLQAGRVTAGRASGQVLGRVGRDTLNGGENADLLIGVPGTDILLGDLGPDRLVGRGGDDVLAGEEGSDELLGGDGPDRLIPGDSIFVDPGQEARDDDVAGGGGQDLVSYIHASHDPVLINLSTGVVTGAGTDTLRGVEGAEGSYGDDVIIGDDADNFMYGGFNGSERFFGEGGDDTFAPDRQSRHPNNREPDDMDGGAGSDTVTYGEQYNGRAVRVNLVTGRAHGQGRDTVVDVENVIGTGLRDTLIGDDESNDLHGGGGDDHLFGKGGDDVLEPDGENACYRPRSDQMSGGAGWDLLTYDNLRPSCNTPLTIDLADGTATGLGSDLFSGVEDATGGGGADELRGDERDNDLSGGGGDDDIDGRDGVDTAYGGADTDRCVAETARRCES